MIASTFALVCGAAVAVHAQRNGVTPLDNALACITKGNLTFCPADTGRVVGFAVNGVDYFGHYFGAYDYFICHSAAVDAASAYSATNDFVNTSITQPGGPGTLPLTVVAHSSDSAWQTKTVFTLNTAEQELDLTITLTRLGGAVSAAAFAIGSDDAAGGTYIDTYDRSNLSVEQTGNGGMLFYNLLTRGTAHSTAILIEGNPPNGCNLTSVPTPGGPDNLASTSLSCLPSESVRPLRAEK
jgi:hypothetical protein